MFYNFMQCKSRSSCPINAKKTDYSLSKFHQKLTEIDLCQVQLNIKFHEIWLHVPQNV